VYDLINNALCAVYDVWIGAQKYMQCPVVLVGFSTVITGTIAVHTSLYIKVSVIVSVALRDSDPESRDPGRFSQSRILGLAML